jgi:hypothetical protein
MPPICICEVVTNRAIYLPTKRDTMIDLKSISKNSPKPPRITIYGPAGIGKTTFASQAPSPIFIITEDGLGDLEVPKFPLATSFSEVLESLEVLGKENHEFKTVVIDSLDWLEPLVWEATCKRLGVPSIESPGYGKGYVECATEWREFFKYVTALRDFKNMTVVMLAHGSIVRVEDPIHPAYDTHTLKLHKRAAAIAEEFSDIVGFASHKTLIKTEEAGFGEKRNRAIATGERVLYLSGTASFTAKNRFSMPELVSLDWTEFEKYLPSGGK